MYFLTTMPWMETKGRSYGGRGGRLPPPLHVTAPLRGVGKDPKLTKKRKTSKKD